MFRKLISLLVLPLLCAAPSLAQTGPTSLFNTPKLDSLLTMLDAHHQLMGSLQLTR